MRVRVVATGTGEALERARRGDADLALTHDSAAEAAFVRSGHGVERRPLLRTEFTIAGPPADPAGVRGLTDAAEALRRIERGRHAFVSRGDDSGTHRRELELWRSAGVDPRRLRDDYLQAGQGMGETLLIANERSAYALTDLPTLRALSRVVELEPLVRGDRRFHNPYGLVLRAEESADARLLADWLAGDEARRIIAGFRAGRGGPPLYQPVPPLR